MAEPKDIRTHRERYLDDIKAMLHEEKGRRFLWELLSLTRLFSSSMSKTDRDTAFNEGKRAIGITIFADIIEADTEGYVRLIKENENTIELDTIAQRNREAENE